MTKRIIYIFLVGTLVWSCNSYVTREADDLYMKGEYKAAIIQYDEFLATKPKDVKSLYNRGRAYEELGQVEKAKADFIRVLDIDSENINANLSMGKYWSNREQHNQATNFFDKVLRKDARNVTAYLLKGRSFHKTGDFKEAIKNYNLAVEFDKKNQDAFLYRGALRINIGQVRRACDDLNRAKVLGSSEAAKAFNKYCKN